MVETDSLRYHRTPAQQARDRERDQAHTAAGRTPLRFTHAQVRYEPDACDRHAHRRRSAPNLQPMKSDAFTAAVERQDPERLRESLAEEVTFLSPVVFRAYEGREVVATILTEGAMKVFSDFRYVERLEDERCATLIFEARVGDRDVQGLDLLRFDDQDKVEELIVMVRPLSGLTALAEAMGREFERVGIVPPRG